MKKGYLIHLFVRYTLVLILGLGNLAIIYALCTPLTLYPLSSILRVFYPQAIQAGATITIDRYVVVIVPACIAGAAYYLLIALNMLTPMPMQKRIHSMAFLVLSFLVVNLIRIILFINLYIKQGQAVFTQWHAAVWYGGSTLLVVAVWLTSVQIYKIKAIPVYTDIKNLYHYIKRRR